MPADAISQSTAEKIPENYRRSDLRHGYDDHPAMKSMKPHCAFHLSHLGDRKPHLHDKGDEFRAEELLTVELDVVRDEVVVLLRHKKGFRAGLPFVLRLCGSDLGRQVERPTWQQLEFFELARSPKC